MRYYLDAAPVIYAVEGVPPYAAAVDSRLSATDAVRVVSDLTRMECRVRPIRDGKEELLEDFDEYFHGTVNEVVSLSRAIIDQAHEHSRKVRVQNPRRYTSCCSGGISLRCVFDERSSTRPIRRPDGRRRPDLA